MRNTQPALLPQSLIVIDPLYAFKTVVIGVVTSQWSTLSPCGATLKASVVVGASVCPGGRAVKGAADRGC